MKIFNYIIILFLATGVFVSCETDSQVDIGQTDEATPAELTSIERAFFDEADKENTYVEFTFDIPDGYSVTEAKLQISINSQAERVDYGSFTSFPATVNLPLTDVATTLGKSVDDIAGGDVINIEVLTQSNDSYSRSNAVLNPLVACSYDPDEVSGSYDVVSSSWESSGVVTLTALEEDPYQIEVVGLAAMDGLTEDQGPLVFIVDPSDYSVTAPKTTLATEAWGYNNYSYEGTAGSLNTCDGTYNMSFSITVDEGSFGSYSDFIFTKK